MLARARRHGFTLIELMMVVAIVGILAAIAVPSSREHVVKTRRAEGKALVTEVAARLERCYTRFSAYNHASCTPVAEATSEGGWYATSVGATGSVLAAQSFTLRAVPQNSQATDDTRCGTLTLTQTGVKGQTGTPPSGYTCW
jgi:type IV pilus assembly protein PilE